LEAGKLGGYDDGRLGSDKKRLRFRLKLRKRLNIIINQNYFLKASKHPGVKQNAERL